MKGVKCVACGFVGWAEQETCKKCGAAMPTPLNQTAVEPPPPLVPAHNTGYQQWTPTQNLKQGLAITSLIIGCVNFVTAGFLGLGAATGLTFGIIALQKAKKHPELNGGQGMAIAGVATNGFWLLMAIPIVLAIALPNLLAARVAANEAAAISSLRSIADAEDTFYRTHQRFGELSDLAADGLIKSEFATGFRAGYKFRVRQMNIPGATLLKFDVTAVPTSYRNSGRRSFLIDETGIVRAGDNHGYEVNRYARSLDDD